MQSRDEEIDRKDSVINNLIKDSLSAVANNIHLDKVENDITEDLNIDGLFDEDLGGVGFDDILNISGCSNILATDLTVDNIFDTLEEKSELLDEGSTASNNNDDEVDKIPSTKDPSIIERLVEQSKNLATVMVTGSPKRTIVDKLEVSKRKRETDNSHSPSKKRKTEPRSLQCPHCDKQFPLGGSWKLKKHINRQHSDEAKFSCNQCKETFNKESVFLSHKERHDNPVPWRCKVCKRSYNQMLDLVQHAKRRHGLLNDDDEAIEKVL